MIATSLVLCSALLGQPGLRPLDIPSNPSNPSNFQGGSNFNNARGGPAVMDENGFAPRDNGGRVVQPSQPRQQPVGRPENDFESPHDTRNNYASNVSAPEAQLISDALHAPPESKLTGRRLALVDALSHATSRAQKLEITRAYWKLALITADHNFAVDENLQIEKVSDPTGDRLATTLLRAARQSTKGMREESLVNAQLAQTELAKLLNFSSQDQMPMAGDLPFVGQYRTEFTRIFANKVAPARLRALDQILPGRHDVIQKRAYAVTNAFEAQAEAEKAFMAGTGSAAQAAGLVVLCRNEVRKQRKLFLDAVREYNFDIAEYALNVTESTQMRDELVVGMLIRSPLPSAGGVKPSGGQPTRTTFVESGDVTPASANLDAEKPKVKSPVAQSEPAEPKSSPREPAKLDVSSMPSVMRPARPEEERMAPIAQAELSSVPRNRDNPGPWSAADDQLSARSSGRADLQSRGESTFRNEMPAATDSMRSLPDNRAHRGAPAAFADDPLGSSSTSLPPASGAPARASSGAELSPNMQADPFAPRTQGSNRQSIKVRAAE